MGTQCASVAHDISAGAHYWDISRCIFANIKSYNENVVLFCSWQLGIPLSGNYFVISSDRLNYRHAAPIRVKENKMFFFFSFFLVIYISFLCLGIINSLFSPPVNRRRWRTITKNSLQLGLYYSWLRVAPNSSQRQTSKRVACPLSRAQRLHFVRCFAEIRDYL